jgi:hypothetical protein
MTRDLIWMPDVLVRAGLKVAPDPHWVGRSYRSMGQVLGVMCHHTGVRNAQNRNMPSLGSLQRGRSDLRGPLAQLGLGRDGTFYLIAAGRANHAGEGRWRGIRQNSGNAHFIGIEAENDGRSAANWPPVQMDAYLRGVAGLLDHLRAPTSLCIGHKEYAPSRKPDPSFDMEVFRSSVEAIRRGQGTVRPLIPAIDAEGSPTLRRGMRGENVERMQKLLEQVVDGLVVDGVFGPVTEAQVRRFQRDRGLVADGIVGPKTWQVLRSQARSGDHGVVPPTD